MRETPSARLASRHHLPRRLAALLFSVAMLGIGGAASPATVAAGGSCSGYAGHLTPPSFIYVLRQSGPNKGYREKVPMVKWTKHVLGTQMPGYYPRAALRANAIFVKQYGWYYTMEGHWRGGRDAAGRCYDVKDAGDGWYVPEKRGYTASQSDAVDATWRYSIRKRSNHHWKFILTGYRSGAFVSCGTDSDGWHLMQHSAYDCGKKGFTWRQIIPKYVSRSLIIDRDGGPGQAT